MVKIKEVEGITEAEFEMFAEKKDDQVRKVKARYKVWSPFPSSVQCPKKGAQLGVTRARNEDKRFKRIPDREYVTPKKTLQRLRTKFMIGNIKTTAYRKDTSLKDYFEVIDSFDLTQSKSKKVRLTQTWCVP